MMEKRFDETIKNISFSTLEMRGFQKIPTLAIKAGMAIGYQMACDDLKEKLDNMLETK